MTSFLNSLSILDPLRKISSIEHLLARISLQERTKISRRSFSKKMLHFLENDTIFSAYSCYPDGSSTKTRYFVHEHKHYFLQYDLMSNENDLSTTKSDCKIVFWVNP